MMVNQLIAKKKRSEQIESKRSTNSMLAKLSLPVRESFHVVDVYF